jgi:hypothetical protein
MPSRHRYDNASIDSVQFLYAVMHDPAVPLEERIKAAGILIELGFGDHQPRGEPAVIYRFADYQPHGEAADDKTRAA